MRSSLAVASILSSESRTLPLSPGSARALSRTPLALQLSVCPARRLQQVHDLSNLLALTDVIESVGGNIPELLFEPAGPAHFNAGHDRLLSKAEVEARVV